MKLPTLFFASFHDQSFTLTSTAAGFEWLFKLRGKTLVIIFANNLFLIDDERLTQNTMFKMFCFLCHNLHVSFSILVMFK